jgi:hypothetical protein
MSEWAEIAGAGCRASEKWSKRGWFWRNMAVELSHGELLVYSPIVGLGQAAHDSLRALGRPAVLLTGPPSSFPITARWCAAMIWRAGWPSLPVRACREAARIRLKGQDEHALDHAHGRAQEAADQDQGELVLLEDAAQDALELGLGQAGQAVLHGL